VGQPKVERKLCALGQGAKENEDERREVERMRPNAVARGQHQVELVSPDDVAEHQHACEQAQPPGGGNGQRHARALARRRGVMPVADQQKGEEAGQLPEESQLNQVAGENYARHGAHECEQEREEARHRVFGRHIVARIENHERADARHEPREEPGEAVHSQDEVEPE
jgi:hypothetical protein